MEKWKDRIMSSLDGMERANPSDDGFQKIQQKLADQKPSRQWIVVAASITLVLSVNVYAVWNYNSESASTESDDYPAIVSSYNLYDNE